jgi:error-prone DNA polymerase
MSTLERTLADYEGTGVTVGPQLVHHLRPELERQGVLRAADLPRARHGAWVKIAGLVIVRQRPGTAKGFCFLTLEDETGIGNVVIVPDLFRQYRAVVHTAALLLVEGPVQKVEDVIHVRARRLQPLQVHRRPIDLRGQGYRMRVDPGREANHDLPPPRSFR